MAAEGVSLGLFLGMMILFVAVTILLGLYGYRNTKDNQQFLLGRNKTNATIIGLSYGATFLSASAIIGFGGQAAVHGMSLIWLCFLNIALGIFVPFIFFAKRIRRMGKKHGASTFADLLGKIYGSKGIRGFVAVLIIVMMPIYCAAVLKGAVNTLVVLTGFTDIYNVVLIILAFVVGIYVVYGGIIAVMYNDALQAGIMIIGMVVIFVVTLTTLGGFTNAVDSLAGLGTTTGGTLPGYNGLTSAPDFLSPEWLTVVSTFILGVGIGVMTQPQLTVRFMSAKDDKTLNRSMLIGGVFIFVIIGIAYTVGPLTNAYFMDTHSMTSYQYVVGELKQGVDFIIPNFVLDVFKGSSYGEVFICVFILALLCAAISTLSALMHTIGVAGGHDLYEISKGRTAKNKMTKAAVDITKTLRIFGRNLQYTFTKKKPAEASNDSQSLFVNRTVTAIVMVLIVVYCYLMPNDIIAKATALFMGITAAALLPLMAYGLFAKKPRKNVAIASMSVGTAAYLFWALFINASSSVFLPIYKMITGNKVIFMDSNIMYVDALVVALPLSLLTLMVAYAIMWWKNRSAAALGIKDD
jgi:SSS family solute:Na+ symporter